MFNRKNLNILKNIRKMKWNSNNSNRKINKSCNGINSRNPIKSKNY